MLAALGNRWQYNVSNLGTNPSATPGVSVVPGASNAEGTWTASGLGTTGEEIYGLFIWVVSGATSGSDRAMLLDIGVDPAAGTSYTAVISNIVCGSSSTIALGNGHQFYFPIRIPKGSTVGVRVQNANATAGTVRIGLKGYGAPSAPELVRVGSFSETIGSITNSNGVTFTPGNAADGAWTLLGTTAKDLWWWQVAAQITNGTITAQYTYVDIAVGDATNKTVIARTQLSVVGTAETESNCANSMIEGYWEVAAGSNLYIRGRCNTAPGTTYNGVAIGIGG